MNRIYKVIWSKAKNCYIVASELAKRSVVTACVLAALFPGTTYAAIAEGDNTPATGGEVFDYVNQLEQDINNRFLSGASYVYVDSSADFDIQYSNNALMIGKSSMYAADNSVLVGNNSGVSGTGVVLVGSNSNASMNLGVVIGNENEIMGDEMTVLGIRNGTGGNPSSSIIIGNGNWIGDDEEPSYGNNIIIGQETEVYASDNILIGSGIESEEEGAIVLGNGSKAVANALSVGTPRNMRRIVHVADGTTKTDASTVGQTGSSLSLEDNVLTLHDPLGNSLSSVVVETQSGGQSDRLKVDMTNLAAEGEQKIKTLMAEELLLKADNDLSSLSSSGEDKIRSVVEEDLLDKADRTLGNITTEGETVIRNIASDAVQVLPGESVAVTKEMQDGNSIYTVDVVKDGQIVSGNTGLLTGGQVYEVLGEKADKSNVYSRTETDNLLIVKADVSSVYSKTEADALLAGKADVSYVDDELALKADKSSVYTKEEANALLDAKADLSYVDENLALKADKNTVYTKKETDTLLNDKANIQYVDDGLVLKADKSSVYTKEESDALLNNKADVSAVYSKEEADLLLSAKADASSVYAKDEVDGLLADKADVSSVYTRTETDNLLNAKADVTVLNTLQDSLKVSDGQVVLQNNTVGENLQLIDRALTNKADVSLENISDDGIAKIKSIAKVTGGNHVTVSDENRIDVTADGAIAEGDTHLVTGDTVYQAVQNIVSGEQQDTHYVGIHSTSLSDVNYNGGGATGEDAIAVGASAVASGDRAVALGYGSIADSADVVSVGNPDALRRIVNVADGTSAQDVSTVKQTGSTLLLDNNKIVLQNALGDELGSADLSPVLSGNLVKYDSDQKDVLTFGGSRGTKLTNLKAGTLSRTSTDAVIGSQLYATNQNVSSLMQAMDNNRNDIATLNEGITSAIELAQVTGNLVNTIDALKADVSMNNLTDTGKKVIADIAREVMGVPINKMVGLQAFSMSKVIPDNTEDVIEVTENEVIQDVQTPVVLMNTDSSALEETNARVDAVELSIGTTKDGNYIKSDASIGTNLGALDTAIGHTSDGAFVRSGVSVGENLNALDAQVAKNTDNISAIADSQGKLRRDMHKLGARAGALAGLRPFGVDGRWDVAAGFGNYKGENAGAFGVFYRPTDRVMISLASTIDGSDNIVSGGISYALDKANRSGLEAKVARLEKEKAEQGRRIEELERVVRQLAER